MRINSRRHPFTRESTELSTLLRITHFIFLNRSCLCSIAFLHLTRHTSKLSSSRLSLAENQEKRKLQWVTLEIERKKNCNNSFRSNKPALEEFVSISNRWWRMWDWVHSFALVNTDSSVYSTRSRFISQTYLVSKKRSLFVSCLSLKSSRFCSRDRRRLLSSLILTYIYIYIQESVKSALSAVLFKIQQFIDSSSRFFS